jgi:hypothetical protein
MAGLVRENSLLSCDRDELFPDLRPCPTPVGQAGEETWHPRSSREMTVLNLTLFLSLISSKILIKKQYYQEKKQ